MELVKPLTEWYQILVLGNDLCWKWWESACVYLHLCWGVHAPWCANLCMWRLEANTTCLSQMVFTFFGRQRFLNLELTHWLAQLASKALGFVHCTS